MLGHLNIADHLHVVNVDFVLAYCLNGFITENEVEYENSTSPSNGCNVYI